jgi:hypothetical protein
LKLRSASPGVLDRRFAIRSAMRSRLAFCLLAACFAAGCEHADPLEPDGLQPTLSSIQANIFDQSCALSNCHAGSNPRQGLDLSAGQAYAHLVGIPSAEQPNLDRIEPNQPEASYLFLKITGNPSIAGQRMPLGRAPLTAEEISVVRAWIEAGAPND